MPIVKNKNGDWVNVDDSVSPQRLAQITGGRVQNTSQQAPVTSTQPVPKSEAEQRADSYQGKSILPDTIHDAVRGFGRGALANFGDEIAGGIRGATNSVANVFGMGNGKSFSDEYQTARDAERILDQRAEARSPIASAAGELGGALTMPLPGAGVVKSVPVLGKVAEALGGRLAGSAVAHGAAVGASQGALNAAGSATDLANTPDAIGEGALIGGATGGVLGGITKFGSAAINAIRDRAPAAAERMAFTKAAERLNQGKMTGADAAAELSSANASGNDMRFMDLTPGTRADAAYYSRRPNLDASNDLHAVTEDRTLARGERFTDQIAKTADTPANGSDSNQLIDDIIAKRKADGHADYAVGGAMDAPVNWSPELDKFWAEAPADTRNTMLKARAEIEGRRGDPDQHIQDNGDGSMTIVPSLRTFDYLKRGFDGAIGDAKAAGDMQKVQRLQAESSTFKGLFADANDTNEYSKLLLKQRTGFERQQAAELGQGVLSRIGNGRNGAREELKTIGNLKDHEKEDYRTGILDALTGLDAKANPLGTFNGYMRNAKQRDVMAFAFGGEDKLNDFQKYLARELKSQKTDKAVSGTQSITSSVGLSAAEDADPAVGNAFNQILKGYVLAGPLGGLSNTVRQVGHLTGGMGKAAQEAYGKVLSSDGTGLAAGVDNANKFNAMRQTRVMRRAAGAAKAGQQTYTDLLGKQ